MDVEIERIASKFHSLRSRLKRNPSTGCLEYIGPKRGPSSGNPQLIITTPRGKKTSILLRRWVWLSHKKTIPTGKYTIMSCRNYRCVEFKHQYLGKMSSKYRLYLPDANKYLTPDVVIALRYFEGTVPPIMLARCFPRVSIDKIRKVLKHETFPEISVPKGYRPPLVLIQKLESLSSRRAHYRRFIGPMTIQIAIKDIAQSNLTPRERKILRQYVQSVSVNVISKVEGVTRTRIYFIIHAALQKVQKELGNRRWITLLSIPPRRG